MNTAKKLPISGLDVEDLLVGKQEGDSLEDTAETYKLLKRELENLEEMLKPLRSTLEAAATEAGGSIIAGPYKITLSNCERESFNLKLAKETLSPKVLKPFLSTTSYKTLRVS